MKCAESVDTRKYNRVVSIESLDESQVDALNTPIEKWDEYHKCRAMGRPVSGREYFQAQQAQAIVTHRYRVLWNSRTKRITPKMRLIDKTDADNFQTMNITRAINVGGANREMEIDCVEVV